MGWAKYMEDNKEIYEERMALRDAGVYLYKPTKKNTVNCKQNLSCSEFHITPRPAPVGQIHRGKEKNNGRNGIELVFSFKPDNSVARKLQINGWWWSKAKGCWCNSNTIVNRTYAESILLRIGVVTNIAS